MTETITATYVAHDDEWSVTVSAAGEELTEHAPGIIAARDQADQLIESFESADDGEAVVVHLLNGSALEFTTAYMTARLSRTSTDSAEPAHADSGNDVDSTVETNTVETKNAAHTIPEQAAGEHGRASSNTESERGSEREDDVGAAAGSAQ